MPPQQRWVEAVPRPTYPAQREQHHAPNGARATSCLPGGPHEFVAACLQARYNQLTNQIWLVGRILPTFALYSPTVVPKTLSNWGEKQSS